MVPALLVIGSVQMYHSHSASAGLATSKCIGHSYDVDASVELYQRRLMPLCPSPIYGRRSAEKSRGDQSLPSTPSFALLFL